MALWTVGARETRDRMPEEFNAPARKESARCFAAGLLIQAWMDAGCPVGSFKAEVSGRKAFAAMDRTGQTATYVPTACVDADVPGLEDRGIVVEVDIRGKARVIIGFEEGYPPTFEF